ncbi:hypothetical protein GJ744_009940 [Endocarpon pusillum]|uniref:Uncharacterized protein n=1 Tax=Endocarpon pusillum TaxID=364733 RepID=A0A8H7AIZ2_9EURO|nr:hypothetical protein GJ744_009940 [Endocarpon pusillum]
MSLLPGRLHPQPARFYSLLGERFCKHVFTNWDETATAIMAYLFDDLYQLDKYQGLVDNQKLEGGSEVAVDILEWPRDSSEPSDLLWKSITVDQLPSLRLASLRIILAPLDEPNARTLKVLTSLYRQFNVPPCFLTERTQGVTHSFGVREDDSASYSSWFHYLFKNVHVQRDGDDVPRIVSPLSNPLSQSDLSWNKAGFFLHQSGPGGLVTLICFGPGKPLVRRLERLVSHAKWRDAVVDPYSLFVVVLNELFLQMDGLVWGLSSVFGAMEYNALHDLSSTPDFVGLHNVAKHIVYMKEGIDAALATHQSMLQNHEQRYQIKSSKTPEPIPKATHSALQHQGELFRSISIRLTSLDRRMQNIINLSFNLVTQQDSRIMKNDNSSMKTIAGVTLLFLPVTTIATVFSTPFFSLPDDGSATPRFHVAPWFWVFWAITVPVTIVVCVGGFLYHRSDRRKGWTTRARSRREEYKTA